MREIRMQRDFKVSPYRNFAVAHGPEFTRYCVYSVLCELGSEQTRY